MFDNAWSQRTAQAQARRQELAREAAQSDRQIASLLDRVVEATNASVIRTYEARIAALEQRKLAVVDAIDRLRAPARGFDELFELAMDFLRNPCKLWDSGQLALRRTVLRTGLCRTDCLLPEYRASNSKNSLALQALGWVLMRELGNGAPERSFEPTQIRSLVLYPIELRAHAVPPWGAGGCHVAVGGRVGKGGAARW